MGVGPRALHNRWACRCRRRWRRCRFRKRSGRARRAFFRCRASRRRRCATWRRGICRGWTSTSASQGTVPRRGASPRTPSCPTWRGRGAWDGATSTTAGASSSTMRRRCVNDSARWSKRETTRRPGGWPGRPAGWRLPTPDRGASGPAWGRRSTRASRWRGRFWTGANPCSSRSEVLRCWTSCSGAPRGPGISETRHGSSRRSTRWNAR